MSKPKRRSGSICGPGERIILKPWEPAKWLLAVQAEASKRFADSVSRVTNAMLAAYNRTTGRLDPSYEWLARVGCVSVSTVKRVLKWLRRRGWITRDNRYHQESGDQTSNAYQLRFPSPQELSTDCTDSVEVNHDKNQDSPISKDLWVSLVGLPSAEIIEARQRARDAAWWKQRPTVRAILARRQVE